MFGVSLIECAKPGGSSFLCVFLFCCGVSFGKQKPCVGEEVEQELEVSVDQAISEDTHNEEVVELKNVEEEEAVSHIADCGGFALFIITNRCIFR